MNTPAIDTVSSLKEVRLRKRVPTLYEADEDKYVGPYRWQIQGWARIARRLMRRHAYTRWLEQGFDQIQVKGLEHLEGIAGPCLFIANHQSHLDTPLAHFAMPERIRARLYFGAAQDRWFVKGKKKLMLKPWYQSLAMGNFPIMRGGGKQALSHAHWLLSRGQCVFLFPEGTRATTDALGEFKHGATLLALQNRVPVVPLYLAGVKAVRPKGSQAVVRGSAAVEVLAPVTFAEGTDVETATASLYARMSHVHEKYRSSQTSHARSISEAA